MHGASAYRPEPSALEVRYEKAIDSYQQFKELTGCNNQWLADQVHVSCSSVTNFLNRKPNYEPQPTRLSMLAILNGIEGLEGKLDVIAEKDLGKRLHESGCELHRYAVIHAARARAQRGMSPLLRSPGETLVLTMEAIHAPQEVRPHMCSNMLLTLLTYVDKPESQHINPEVLTHTARYARQLEAAVDSGMTIEPPQFYRGAAVNYAGYTLFWAGLHLQDGAMMAEGMEKLLESVSAPHFEGDGVWANSLRVVDEALARELPSGKIWAGSLTDIIQRSSDITLDQALSTKTLPSLQHYWKRSRSKQIRPARLGD